MESIRLGFEVSAPGVAPAGAGVAVLGVAISKNATPAFTGAPSRLLFWIALGLTLNGVVLLLFSRRVVRLPERELGPHRVEPANLNGFEQSVGTEMIFDSDRIES